MVQIATINFALVPLHCAAAKKTAASSDTTPKVLGSVTKPGSKLDVLTAIERPKPAPSKAAAKPSAKVTPAVKPAGREQEDQPEAKGTVAAKRKHKELSAGPVLQSAYMVSIPNLAKQEVSQLQAH